MFKGLLGILFWYPEELSWCWHRPKCADLITGHPHWGIPCGDGTHSMNKIIVGKMHYFSSGNLVSLVCGMCFLWCRTENCFFQKITRCLAPPSSSWHFPVWIILNVGFRNLPTPNRHVFPGGTLDSAPWCVLAPSCLSAWLLAVQHVMG